MFSDRKMRLLARKILLFSESIIDSFGKGRLYISDRNADIAYICIHLTTTSLS
jgi:hypothetical protein